MYFADFARRPIDTALPCGTNPNDSDDFTEIKRQINNINKVTGHVSWKKVQSLSKSILTKESKDFRCACYYTVAATQNEGMKGLIEGLNVVLDLCVVYWHSAFPAETKTKARIGAIEWMVEHTERRLLKMKVNQEDLPLIEAGHRLTLRIEEELRLHYELKSPSLGAIRRILTQWTEGIKNEIAENEKAEKTKLSAIMQHADPIKPIGDTKVEITKPSSPIKVEKPEPKTKCKQWSPAAAIATIIGVFFAALISHFAYQDHQVQTLTHRIKDASVAQLAQLTTNFLNETDKTKLAIKEPLVSRVDTLLINWDLDPIKVNQVAALKEITDNIATLYPDSSTANRLKSAFTEKKNNLEQEYQQLHHQFLRARTVFANVKAGSTDANVEKAYKYSNTLFPLLGRMEYTEKKSVAEELTKSQRLLNVFQHKLNLLKRDLAL